MIKLGRKLENPYSVENMKQAWGNLTSSDALARSFSDALDISTTHYYVKFDPKTTAQLGILKLDSTINLFEYPLDYEILVDGSFYHDPSLPLERPTYQYAPVPVGYDFPPEVAYEILAELFIPDDYSDNVENTFVRSTSPQVIRDIVAEALRITNNLDDKSENGRAQWSCSGTTRPGGSVRVWDSTTKNPLGEPVRDLEIKATRWFTTHEGKVDANGNFSCDGTFENDFNYSFKWEKYNFEIREEGGGTPGQTKNSTCGQWNLFFGESHKSYDHVKGDDQMYGVVFRAARQYYYGDNKGLRRPPENGTLVSKLQIKAVNKPDPDGSFGDHSPLRRFLGGVDIKVYNDKRSSEQLYGTTIHELALSLEYVLLSIYVRRQSSL